MSDTMNEENEKIPAVVAPSAGTNNDNVHGRCSLRQLRSSYADAFLSRCNKVDPNNLGLPLGTYVCPWMPGKLEEEIYHECGNSGFGAVHREQVECRNCGKIFDEGTSDASQHRNDCWIKMYKQIKEHVEESCDEGLQKRDSKKCTIGGCVAALKERIVGSEELKLQTAKLEQQTLEYKKLDEYNKNPWKKLTQESNETIEKDLEYWSSHCETRDLPLFGSMVMRRPDISCSKQLKMQHDNKNLDFGSQCFQASLLPSDSNTFPGYSPCAIQTTWAPIDEAWNSCDTYYGHSYDAYSNFSAQYMGINYTKDAVWTYNQGRTLDEEEEKEVWRPFAPYFSVPAEGVNPSINRHKGLVPLMTQFGIEHLQIQQHGGSKADVWTTQNQDIGPRIKPLLEDLANSSNDRPLPRYQMIIDPNQFVRPRKSDGKMVWVPCEFDVTSDGSGVSLVGNERAHWMDTALIDSVATPVLSAALPLLAKLTKPYLLLEGQRLQVVVKAQSITVPKKQENDDAPEYVGLWHVDGEHEPVVAVVLYYYDVDDALVGGNMEFMDRRPIGALGVGDTDLPSEIPTEELREAFRPSSNDGGEALIPNCSVPIKTGTMMVFSNYQMAHRVLRMVNTSQERPASRKFVALFVMDPAAERLVPAKSHLAHAYLYKRALMGTCEGFAGDSSAAGLPAPVAELVMEFLGIVPSQQERRATRNEMLRSQLIPKKSLGASPDMVCSTGNGCVTMLGWIDSLLTDHKRDRIQNGGVWRYSYTQEEFVKADRRMNALNYPPNEVGRGLSETLSIPSDDLNLASFYDTLDGRNLQLNADFEKTN